MNRALIHVAAAVVTIAALIVWEWRDRKMPTPDFAAPPRDWTD